MIRSFQGFRFIFALMIFFHHIIIPSIDSLGLYPVVFFYILSGFVLSAGYGKKIDNGDLNYAFFIKKRVQRIYPIHLVTLAIAVLILLATHIYAGTEINGFLKVMIPIVPNILLIHSWIPVRAFYFSGNVVSWFLANTLFFYIVFPYLYKLVKRLKWFLPILFFLYTAIVSIIPDDYLHALVYINPMSRIFDFILGISLFELYNGINNKQNKEVDKSFLMTLIEIIILCVSIYTLMIQTKVPSWISISILFWIPATLIILVFPFTERRGGQISVLLGSKMMIWLGTISFSFFMFHQLLIRVYFLADSHLPLNISTFTASLVLIPLTILISYIYQYKLEPIILKIVKRDEKKKRV